MSQHTPRQVHQLDQLSAQASDLIRIGAATGHLTESTPSARVSLWLTEKIRDMEARGGPSATCNHINEMMHKNEMNMIGVLHLGEEVITCLSCIKLVRQIQLCDRCGGPGPFRAGIVQIEALIVNAGLCVRCTEELTDED